MKYFSKLNKIVFLLSLIASIVFTFYSFPLPKDDQVLPYIKDLEPMISPIDEEAYIKDFNGVKYRLTPLYSYEAYGVIVEHYNSDNWLDVVHEGDPAQTKDICIVWGDNIKDGIYRKVKYSHGEFTCFVKYGSWENRNKFNQNELTNNHLIPSNDDLEEIMKRTEIGDQVYIKGKLVHYEVLDDNGEVVGKRFTDNKMGNYECEVVYVEDYQILRTRHPLIKNTREYSYSLLAVSTILGIVIFIIS